MYIESALQNEHTVDHQYTSLSKASVQHSKNRNHLTPKKSVNNMLHLEISAEIVNKLLALRQLCAEDIRCLDNHSQQYLRDICLNTCLLSAGN